MTLPRFARRPPGRRAPVAAATLLALLALAGCATTSSSAAEYSPDKPLPTGTPSADTSLRVAGRTTQLQLQAAGSAIAPLDFAVSDWVNVGAGPDVIQAFRADAVDIASNAILPPIQAHAIGFDAKVVAVLERPQPSYVFATAPGTDISSFADFRGTKIAFSQGQSQGDTVLRTLQAEGIDYDDVELVDLPSTQFLTALQGGQVDVAPLSEPAVTKYIDDYAQDGARAIPSQVPDLLTVLWAPAEVLADDDNVRAIRDYIRTWAQGQVWAWEHADAWKKFYYVDTEGVSDTDADRIWATANKPLFPDDWDKAVDWAQSSIGLLADGGFIDKGFDAEELFDRRFEHDAAAAVAAQYTREG
ncbi:ABC transporter substrate-binding protein [Microbacterium protaetiae]|uniref:ABC transporter substrate-binding protein n=1 Tax=Microbacterium protaetiae TaxID=2509458 RepID=A0A4V0YD27_9MICO|nr:ABC transporter substrate-binding protein [Microbacterium protaetiae]QAY59251.1 ABC transporter substrate-binding protein [Microbacterium protaetiae]